MTSSLHLIFYIHYFNLILFLLWNSGHLAYFRLEFLRLQQAEISSSSQLDFFQVWSKLDLEKLKFQLQIGRGWVLSSSKNNTTHLSCTKNQYLQFRTICKKKVLTVKCNLAIIPWPQVNSTELWDYYFIYPIPIKGPDNAHNIGLSQPRFLTFRHPWIVHLILE